MIKLSISPNIAQVDGYIDDIKRRQLPFATALALTRTAQYVKTELTGQMDKAFDRPTPFTKNALYVRPASKDNLLAYVQVKDEAAKGNPAVRWFYPEVQGGSRNVKGFESLLIRSGILTSGWYAIPTSLAQLDSYGNVPGSTITAILSQLQSARDSQANEPAARRTKRNRTRSNKRYFAVRSWESHSGGLKPGIYERFGFARGSAVRPIFVFTQKTPTYSRRYDFYGIGQRLAQQRFPTEFRTAIQIAVSTAR